MKETEELINKVNEALDACHYDNALKYLYEALSLDNKNPEIYYKIGVIYSLKGFLKEAESNYFTAVSIMPENPDYNFALAYLYYVNNKKEEAEKLVNHVISLNCPRKFQNEERERNIGSSDLKGEHLYISDEPEAKCDIGLDSEQIKPLALKLLILLDTDNITESARVCEKLNVINKSDDFSFYAQSIFYSKLNNWKKALGLIKSALKIKPLSVEYNSESAKYNLYLKDYKKTIEVCENLKKINPKYIEAYIMEAKAYLELEDYNKALENLDKAYEFDINCLDIFIIRGDLYLKIKNYEKAVEAYKTALVINPENVYLYEKTAECYYCIKDYKNAFMYYKEASLIDVSNPEYKYYMGKCAQNNEETEISALNYSLACRLSPKNIKYLEDYAIFLLKNKGSKHALSLLKNSIKRYSEKEDKEKLKKLINKIKNKS